MAVMCSITTLAAFTATFIFHFVFLETYHMNQMHIHLENRKTEKLPCWICSKIHPVQCSDLNSGGLACKKAGWYYLPLLLTWFVNHRYIASKHECSHLAITANRHWQKKYNPLICLILKTKQKKLTMSLVITMSCGNELCYLSKRFLLLSLTQLPGKKIPSGVSLSQRIPPSSNSPHCS